MALNAFDVPDPGSFCMLPEQLEWLEGQLREAEDRGQTVVLLLHCYPTDLKEGGERLRELVKGPGVRLIEMGHTHYNEVANDGRTLYAATRSTGQIEEGPVGFSVTNLDGDVVSWKFVALEEQPVVMITSPAEERFVTDDARAARVGLGGTVRVRAKIWGESPVRSAVAMLERGMAVLAPVAGSRVWEGELDQSGLADGVYPLTVRVEDEAGRMAEDRIRAVVGAAFPARERTERDQDNALEAWPERGLLGTQLGPNKNGRKW